MNTNAKCIGVLELAKKELREKHRETEREREREREREGSLSGSAPHGMEEIHGSAAIRGCASEHTRANYVGKCC